MTKKKKQGYLKNSTLILLAFASAFFPRCLVSIGFPDPISFIHFLVVPGSTILVLLCTSHHQNPKQRMITSKFVGGLFILMLIVVASAILNEAGAVNALLSFNLLAEPFILIIGIVSLSFSAESFQRFNRMIFGFFAFHLFLVYLQKYILNVDTWNNLPMAPADRIQGVFFLTGGGHVVGASVSLTFGIYYLVVDKFLPFWLRVVVASACFWNIIIADAKQVLMTFMIAGILLFIVKLQDIIALIKYLTGGSIFGYAFIWCVNNIPAFRAYNTWADPELYGPNGEATLAKTTAFRVIPSHYEHFLNWFLGLGPGHTIGRLGGWLVHQYRHLLGPLGSTIHQASFDVWREAAKFFIVSRSSLFSPLFGWAGIWGDLGLLGLAAYLYLASLVWHYLCINDFSKFLLLTVLVFGLIFSQMEEPGYMLSTAVVIGLQWQKKQLLHSEQQKMNSKA